MWTWSPWQGCCPWVGAGGGGSWVMSMLRVCTSASVWMLFLPPRGLLLACGELGGLPVSELCPFSLGGGEGESLRG